MRFVGGAYLEVSLVDPVAKLCRQREKAGAGFGSRLVWLTVCRSVSDGAKKSLVGYRLCFWS